MSKDIPSQYAEEIYWTWDRKGINLLVASFIDYQDTEEDESPDDYISMN